MQTPHSSQLKTNYFNDKKNYEIKVKEITSTVFEIVDTIENYDGKVDNSNRLNSDIQTEINEKLGSIGYKIDKTSECKTDGRFSNGKLLSKDSSDAILPGGRAMG